MGFVVAEMAETGFRRELTAGLAKADAYMPGEGGLGEGGAGDGSVD